MYNVIYYSIILEGEQTGRNKEIFTYRQTIN